MDDTDFTCALSGITAGDADRVEDADDDDLGELPVGWIRVQLARRVRNPRWVLLQQLKASAIEAQLQNVPAASREEGRLVIEMQVDAAYAALEATIPPYITDEEECFLSPPENDGAIAEEYSKLRAMLNLPAYEIEKKEEK